LCLYAGCVVKQQNFYAKVKNSLKNLIKKQQLIDYLPFGSIEKLAKLKHKDRGTIRGVLQGKWVNIDIIQGAITLIKDDITRKQDFLGNFEEEFQLLKNEIEPKSK